MSDRDVLASWFRLLPTSAESSRTGAGSAESSPRRSLLAGSDRAEEADEDERLYADSLTKCRVLVFALLARRGWRHLPLTCCLSPHPPGWGRRQERSRLEGLRVGRSLLSSCGWHRRCNRWVIEQVEQVFSRAASHLTRRSVLRACAILLPELRGNQAVRKRCRHFLAREFGIDEIHGNGELVTTQLAFLTDVGEIPRLSADQAIDERTRCWPRHPRLADSEA